MVRSTSPRLDSFLVTDPRGRKKNILQPAMRMHVRSRPRYHPAADLAPRNAWTSRVPRACSGLIADPSSAMDNPSEVARRILSGFDGDSSSDPAPSMSVQAQPTTQPTASTRAPTTVPVLAITLAAVGGVVVLAIIFAVIYFRRIKRRVKRMKRATNILAPGVSVSPRSRDTTLYYDGLYSRLFVRTHSFWWLELAPMSPSWPKSATESSVKPDGMRVVSPPTLDLTKSSLHISALSVTSATSVEHFDLPRSPIHRSTIILMPPPAARRSLVPSGVPSSPIRSSLTTTPRPIPTSRSQYYPPPHDHEELSARSNS